MAYQALATGPISFWTPNPTSREFRFLPVASATLESPHCSASNCGRPQNSSKTLEAPQAISRVVLLVWNISGVAMLMARSRSLRCSSHLTLWQAEFAAATRDIFDLQPRMQVM
jgi:hypothetical protein